MKTATGNYVVKNYENKLNDTLRTYIPHIFIDGTEVECEVQSGLNINLGSCGSDAFSIGNMFIPSVSMSLSECTASFEDKEILLKMGLVLDDKTEAYIPIGYFTVEKPIVKNGVTSFTAYGRLMSKGGALYSSSLAYPTQLKNVISEIGTAMGVTIILKNLTATDTINTPIKGELCRDALSKVAGLLGGYVTEDSNGNVVITKYVLDNTSCLTLDTDLCYEFPESNEGEYTVTGLEVIVKEESTAEDGTTVEGEKYTSGTPNVVVLNPYMNENIFKSCASNVVGFSYLPTTVRFLGDLRLEPWDYISLTDDGEKIAAVPCMSISHVWDGGVVTTVTAPGATSAESDGNYSGPLSSKVDKVYLKSLVLEMLLAQKISAEDIRTKYLEAGNLLITGDSAFDGKIVVNYKGDDEEASASLSMDTKGLESYYLTLSGEVKPSLCPSSAAMIVPCFVIDTDHGLYCENWSFFNWLTASQFSAAEAHCNKGLFDSVQTNSLDVYGDLTVGGKSFADLFAQGIQQTPLFAEGNTVDDAIAWLNENGDISKVYLLPNGNIAGYKKVSQAGGKPLFNNLAKPSSSDWKNASRINATGAVTSSTESNAFVSNAFDCKNGDILRIKGVTESSKTASTSAYMTLQPLKSDDTNVLGSSCIYILEPNATVGNRSYWVESICNITDDGVIEYTMLQTVNTNYNTVTYPSGADNLAKARIGGIAIDGMENIIITINEEIKYSQGAEGYQWVDTGMAFVPADYEDRIISLERKTENLEDDVFELQNKKSTVVDSPIVWCALGDSITQGYVSYLENGTPTSKVDAPNCWATKVSELKGWELTNKAIGGTGYINKANSDTVGTTQAWYIARNTDFSPYNLVTLFYGVNDWKGNEQLGTINDAITTPATIYAGMKATIEAIMESNPLCKIVVITPLNCAGYDFNYGTESTNWGLSKSFSNNGTLETIFDAIVDVCEYYGIDYVDMTHKSVVNRKNLLDCLTDGVHPNAETHTLMAYELAKKIQVI